MDLVRRPSILLAAAALSSALLAAPPEARAQMLPYIAAQSSAPFVPLSGGTVIDFGVTRPDDEMATVPIGFSFTFYGRPFTAVSVGVNGIMEMADPCSGSMTCMNQEDPTLQDEVCNAQMVCAHNSHLLGHNIPASFRPYDLLGPWYDDLVYGTGSVMKYAVLGTAPNREFVVEWNTLHHYSFSTTSTAGSMSTATFQVRLSEGTNAIKFAYGPYVASAAENSIWSGGIGIQNWDGTQSLTPLACASMGMSCDYTAISGLANQTIQFAAPMHADLVGAIHGPTGAQPGDTVSIGVRVTNVGVQSTGVPFTANVYLSRRQTLSTTAAVSLGAVHFNALAAGGTNTSTLTVAVPAGTPTAYYYLATVVDPANAVVQDIANAKVAVSADRFLVGNDPAVAIDPIPATGPSDVIRFPLHLLNHGGAIPSVQWAVYLSMDQMHAPTDILLAQGSSPLPAVPDTLITVTATVPMNIVPGSYFAIAVVDPSNMITDADRSNNVAVASFATTVRGPQLFAASVSGQMFAFHGMPYVVTATMRNDGLAPANNFYYGFYASQFPLITFQAAELGEFGPITLMPGETRSVTQVVTIPAGITTGPYYLGMILDTRSAVIEQNQASNITHMRNAITIRDPAPDLTGSEVNVPAQAAAGESFTIERTLSNAGVAPATASYAVYLTMTSSIDTTRDYLLATKSISLAAMQDDRGSDMLRIPGNVPGGSYYVAYWLDPMNQVDELRKDNNKIYSSSTITVLGASLSVLTKTLPIGTLSLPYEVALAAAGGSGTYTWSVSSGMLPPGLMLDGTRGWITGTPTTEGIYNFTVSVTDGRLMVNQDYHLLVAAETRALQVISRSLLPAFVNRPYEYPLTAFGGVPPYVWRALDRLPGGLTLSSMGVLSGTATAAAVTTVNFEVMDAAQKMSTRPIVVRVIRSDGSLRFSEDVLPDARLGEMYDQIVRVEPGTGMAPFAFDLANGELPPGLTIEQDMTHPDQAHVQGVPKAAGTFTAGIRVRDARNDFDVNLYVISVQQGQGVGFVTSSLPTGTVGSPYLDDMGQTVRVKAVAAGSNGVINYSLVSGAMPKGISLGDDGIIRGTPTAAGVSSFIIAAKDSVNEIDVAAFGILVKDAPMSATSTKTKSGGCHCSASGEAQRGDLGGTLAIAFLLALLVIFRARFARALALVLGACLLLAGAETRAQQPMMLPYRITSFVQPYAPRTGTVLPLMSFGSPDLDSGTAVVQLPFSFKYFASTYTAIIVCAKGVATFDPNAFLDGFNTVLPNSGGFENDLIAPFWNNVAVTQVTSTVEGTAPNRVVIIEWDGVGISQMGASDGQSTFQLWLYEGLGGRFEVHYGPMTGTLNSSAWSGTTGFDDPGGNEGHYFFSCNNNCSGQALAAAAGTVYRAEQDGGIDVVASGITVPNVMYPGVPFKIRPTVSSLHSDPIGPFIYQVHLLPAGSVIPNNPIYTSPPITLTPYQVYSVSSSVTLDASTMIGRYKVALVVDPMNQIMDVNRANNTFITESEVRVDPRRPDFTVLRIGATQPYVIAPGGSKDVTLVVANIGNQGSPVTWGAYLSKHQVISPDDLQLATGSLDLGKGQTATVTAHLTVPDMTPTGVYYLGVIMDPMNVVPEISKLNNTLVFTSTFSVSSNMVTITTAALPRGYEGVDYSTFLAASGGDGSYSWAISRGALPDGLNLIPQTGEIHGVPSAKTTAAITVQVTSAHLSATQDLSLQIDPINAGLTIVTRELLPGIVGDAYPPADPGTAAEMQQHIVVASASGNVTFTLTSTAPPGLALDPDGYLHGTPTVRGVFDVTVKATDAMTTVQRTIPLTVAESGRLSLVAAVMPDGRIGEAYQYQIRVVGFSSTSTTPLSFMTSAPLPMGLALGSTGLVSGIPSKVGSSVFTVLVSDNRHPPQVDQANFKVSIVADVGFKITPATLPQAIVGQKYDQLLDAVLEGGMAMDPITWRVQGPKLPAGLMTELRDVNGTKKLAITGTPQAEGFTTVLISADDGAGRHADAPISVYVVPAPPMVKVLPTKKSGCGCAALSDRADGGGSGVALLALVLLGLGFSRRRLTGPWVTLGPPVLRDTGTSCPASGTALPSRADGDPNPSWRRF